MYVLGIFCSYILLVHVFMYEEACLLYITLVASTATLLLLRGLCSSVASGSTMVVGHICCAVD